MTRCQYLYRLQEEQAFLYFHLKPMDEKQHSKWINHIFYLIKQSANQVFDDHEAQLKAKDERIKELDCRAYHAEGYISDLHNEYPKHKKFLDKKARSIVAMLFWEWKEADRLSKTYVDYDYLPRRIARKDEAYYCFDKAYKMLKGNK